MGRRSSAITTTLIPSPLATTPKSLPLVFQPTTGNRRRPRPPASPAGAAELSPRLVGHRRGRDQLAPLLRHQRPRRPAIERTRRLRGDPATLLRLYAEGLIDGMRVDHVDGLTDPPGYCRRLRARLEALTDQRPAGAPAGHPYIVVEKILGAGETMPTDWGVDGTSGYDFMDLVSAVQHDPEAERSLAYFWSAVSGRPADFSTEEALARRQILQRGFDAQLEATATALHRLARLDPLTRDTTQPAIRRALVALLAHFPVYRTYNAGAARSPADQAAFTHALEGAKATLRFRCTRSWTGSIAGSAARRPTSLAGRCAGTRRAASSNSAHRSPPKRSKTPPSTATPACYPATMSGSTCGASASNRQYSMPRTDTGGNLPRRAAGDCNARPQARRGCARPPGGAVGNP